MCHVDALSRNPVLETNPCSSVMNISDEDWLFTLQLGNSELGRIQDILSSDLDSKGLDYMRENYVIRGQ